MTFNMTYPITKKDTINLACLIPEIHKSHLTYHIPAKDTINMACPMPAIDWVNLPKKSKQVQHKVTWVIDNGFLQNTSAT